MEGIAPTMPTNDQLAMIAAAGRQTSLQATPSLDEQLMRQFEVSTRLIDRPVALYDNSLWRSALDSSEKQKNLEALLAGAAGFDKLRLTLDRTPRVAARDTLLQIDEWLHRGATQSVDQFLTLLPALPVSWNIRHSASVEAMVAAMMATRLSKDKIRNRRTFISQTLRRIRWHLGSRAVRSTIHRLA